MEMPGRKWQGSTDEYRYSHNEQEKENAIFANAQSAEYRMYDSRIGRRWERDPIIDPSLPPYATFDNNPIYFADLSGLEGDPVVAKKGDATGAQGSSAPNGGVKNGEGGVIGGEPPCLGCGKNGETTYGIPTDVDVAENKIIPPSNSENTNSSPQSMPMAASTNNVTIDSGPKKQYESAKYLKVDFNLTWGAQAGFKFKVLGTEANAYVNLQSEEWLNFSSEKTPKNPWKNKLQYMGDDDKKKVTRGFGLSAGAGYELSEEKQLYWKGDKRGTAIEGATSHKINALVASTTSTYHHDTHKTDEDVNVGVGMKVAALIGIEIQVSVGKKSNEK
jgi:RHS repeat-associated protein